MPARLRTLGIPHYVLDYEQRFRDTVINPFMESYVAGETPIPCVACNQTSSSPICLATGTRTRRRCAGDRQLHPLEVVPLEGDPGTPRPLPADRF